MNILIVNDDGIEGVGLIALAQKLAPLHNVTVVAPESERSAAGHSYTFQVPLRLKKVEKPEYAGVRAYSTNGTPCDCVILGLEITKKEKIDLILSGINVGANLGTETVASGTVQAALEGCMREYPSIAISQEFPNFFVAEDQYRFFKHAADATERILRGIDYKQLKHYMLSINVPYKEKEEILGYKVCPLGISKNKFFFKPQNDFVGREHYWIDVDRVDHEYNSKNETDSKWIDDGYITITPLYPNLTAKSRMQSTEKLMGFLQK